MYDAVTSAHGRRAAEVAPFRELDLKAAAPAAVPVIGPALAKALSPVLQSVANGVERAPPPPDPANPPVEGGGVGSRPDLDQVLRDYQVKDDEMVNYRPNIPLTGRDITSGRYGEPKRMTKVEAELLDQLQLKHGALGLKKFFDISANDSKDPGLAWRTAGERFPERDANGKPIRGGSDGHNDAFRHAYWNALMTKHFGKDFATEFATAHEGKPGNRADQEAMDLYNNELGRRIALENPDASDEELADLVEQAVRNGEAVVIDGKGELAYSDQVAVGATGKANDPPAEGKIDPSESTLTD